MSSGKKRSVKDDAFRIVKAPYVATWSEFLDRAKQIYRRRPNKVSRLLTSDDDLCFFYPFSNIQTRYTKTYIQNKQMVVVKVTDDFECLKYRTDSVIVVKQLSELNAWIMEQCTSSS